MEMRRESFVFSGVLHLFAALVAIFGLPIFWDEPAEMEAPIVVDLVPIGAKTNPPPKQAEAPQPEPAKPEPPKAEEPKPEPPKPEPKPAPPPPPPPEPKPEPAPAPPPPKPEPKPEPKPDAQKLLESLKPQPRPQQPQNDLDSLLKSIDKKKPTPSNPLDDLLKAAEKGKPNKPSTDQGTKSTPSSVRGSDQHNPNEPISMTEMDAIRAHVSKFWNIPAGAKDAANLIVEIRVTLMPDGTVTDAQVVNRPMLADSFWQAAADSARRAVRLASPLPIPRDKYSQFRDFVLVFNPKQMIGGR